MNYERNFTVGGALLLLLLLLIEYASSDETTAAPIPEPRKLVKRTPTDSIDPLSLDYADEGNYFENGRRLKKAPLAFVGVRGKKYTPGSSRLGELLHSMEEQRSRELLLQDLIERLTADSNNDMVKRAPTGFTGMRGKRLRPDIDMDTDSDELQKRAPGNSFVGMRGKRHYKRAALAETYDVRGKKQRFADYNNKFVAVRGKKGGEFTDAETYTDADTDIDTDMTGDDGQWSVAEQRYLMQPSSYPWSLWVGQQKRAPSGFLGMRGKRPALSE